MWRSGRICRCDQFTTLPRGIGYRKFRHHGLTLIEALLAITLIGVLVAALMPALAASGKNARKLSCILNARSITLGMTAHANDDRYGRFTDDATLGRDALGYLYRDGYLTDYKIAICPATSNQLSASPEHRSDSAISKELPRGIEHAARHAHDTQPGHSYETFHHVNPGQFPEFAIDGFRLLRMDDIIPPSRSFIVLDSDNDPGAGGWNDGLYGYNNLPDRATNNHGESGLNVAFLDGSGRFVTSNKWIETAMNGGHLDGTSVDMVRARRLYDPRLQWGLRNDGGQGLRYWLK